MLLTCSILSSVRIFSTAKKWAVKICWIVRKEREREGILFCLYHISYPNRKLSWKSRSKQRGSYAFLLFFLVVGEPLRFFSFKGLRHNTEKYSVCQGFRLRKRDNYFLVSLGHFWREKYFKAAVAVVIICLSLKPNHHNQIPDTHYISGVQPCSLVRHISGDKGFAVATCVKNWITTAYLWIEIYLWAAVCRHI